MARIWSIRRAGRALTGEAVFLSVCLSVCTPASIASAGWRGTSTASVCLRGGMSPVCLHPEPEAEPKASGRGLGGLAGAQGSRGRGLAAH